MTHPAADGRDAEAELSPRRTPPLKRPADGLILLLAMLLMGGIATYRAVTLDLWGDEVRTWRDSVRKTYPEILTWTHNHDHAPLGHLLAKASADLFGTDAPWALRLPALLFGLSILPLAYALARLSGGRLVGVLVVIMVCVDLTITTQSHQARMYTQYLAWSLASLCCAALLLRHPEHRTALKTAGVGIFLGLALWTHFSAISLLAGVLVTGGVLLVRREDRRAGLGLLVGAGIALLLSVQGLIKLAGMRQREALPGADASDALAQLMDACKGLMGNAPLAVLLFLLAAVGLLLLYRRQRRVALLLLIGVGVGVLNLFIASFYRHIEGPRYLLGFLPAAWVGLGVVNAHMLCHRDRVWRSAFVVLFVGGVGYQFVRTLTTEAHPQATPLRHAAAALPGLGYQSGESLVFAPRDPQRTSALYYGLQHDEALHGRILRNLSDLRASPRTLGRLRPPVLWMIVVTPPRISQRRTANDGLAQAQTAARFFGHDLPADALPTGGDLREMSILRIDEQRLNVWSPTGELRRTLEPRPTPATQPATRPARRNRR